MTFQCFTFLFLANIKQTGLSCSSGLGNNTGSLDDAHKMLPNQTRPLSFPSESCRKGSWKPQLTMLGWLWIYSGWVFNLRVLRANAMGVLYWSQLSIWMKCFQVTDLTQVHWKACSLKQSFVLQTNVTDLPCSVWEEAIPTETQMGNPVGLLVRPTPPNSEESIILPNHYSNFGHWHMMPVPKMHKRWIPPNLNSAL